VDWFGVWGWVSPSSLRGLFWARLLRGWLSSCVVPLEGLGLYWSPFKEEENGTDLTQT